MGFHIDRDSVSAIAKRAEKIADAMPKDVVKPTSAADHTLTANEGSSAATALKYRFQEWSDGYGTLTDQVAGFAEDLVSAVRTWDDIETTGVEVFTKYGKDL